MSTMNQATTPVNGGLKEAPKIVPLRHIGRWVASVLLMVVLVWFIGTLASVSAINYEAIPEYLFNPDVLSGVVLTIQLAVLSQILGIVLGVGLALARQSDNPILTSLSWFYIWIFRGTPLIVQIIFWYNGTVLVFPNVELGLPFADPFLSFRTSDIITLYVASLISLSLNEAAYMAEIVRGGMLAIDRGQQEAAQSIGLRRMESLQAVVLPQALRVIIPPTGNQFLSMIKNTSLISIIAGGELLTNVRNIYSFNGLIFELLVVACIWYLLLTSIAYVGQYYLEKRLSRGFLSVGGRE